VRARRGVAEIGFYHLTRTTTEQALPRLLARVLAEGGRAVVQCADPARLGALDAALWAADQWLPHNGAPDEDPDLQPIWLTATDEPAPNGASFLFLVDGAESERLDAYARILDLFDGGDATATEAARTRWTTARDGGHALTYWRQTERGWEKGL